MASLAQQAQIQLLAAARASGRPAECAVSGSVRVNGGVRAKSSVWTRASAPRQQRYCRLVARAQAALPQRPIAADKAAKEAAALLPQRPAPKVLQARAALLMHKPAVAAELFDRALALDPRSIDQPVAMLDLARAQRSLGQQGAAGRLEQALRSYRRLIPRAALLPDRTTRAAAMLEAAHLAITLAGDANEEQRDRQLDEALALLREAARDPQHALHREVVLSLALAHDRAGYPLRADAVMREQAAAVAHWRPSIAGKAAAGLAFLTHTFDIWALRAMAREGSEPKAAAAHWRRYLAVGEVPAVYRAAAQKRLAALLKAMTRPRKGRR